MTIEKTNQQIVDFYNNAAITIQRLTQEGKRSRYVSILQLQKDHFEENYNAISKKVNRINEKFAKVDDSGCFMYNGVGKDRTYIYDKAEKISLDNAIDELMAEKKKLEVDPIYFLTKEDLPTTESKEIKMSNALIKIFKSFVIPDELADELLYGELKVISVGQ